MKKFSFLLFAILLLSKGMLCQNFFNYNSTPYAIWARFNNDSLDNKYTFGQISGSYSSSKFYFNVPNFLNLGYASLLVKYDSLNNIVYYRTLVTDTFNNGNNGYMRYAITKDFIYVFFLSRSQYSYNGTSYFSSNNFIILKISAITGNLVSTFTYPVFPSNVFFTNYTYSDYGVYISNNKLHLLCYAKATVTFNSISIDSGLFVADYDLNGNFIFARNLPNGVASVNSMLYHNNSYYLTGKHDSAVVSGMPIVRGYLIQLDTNFNLKRKIYYGYETLSAVALNNSILFTACPSYSSSPFQNKVILALADSNFNILKEKGWGVGNTEMFNSYGYSQWRQNVFQHLNVINDRVVFAFVSGLSQDSTVACNASGKTTTNVFINTLDTNLNCMSTLQITNAPSYIKNSALSGNFTYFNESLRITSYKQISCFIAGWTSAYAPDTPFQFFLNKHPYALGKIAKGNLENTLGQSTRSPNVLSFWNDKWLETFLPDKRNYCIGDNIQLTYKKWGTWYPGTVFKLEASANPDFPNGLVRLIGTFTDTINTANLQTTNLKIPNMGSGVFYLRIRSIGPDRTSNLADTTITINSLPTADAGKDITVCEGDTVSLQGNNFGSNFYWTSSIPNIIQDTLAINSKVFTTDSAMCILHVMSAQGCENRDTLFLNVIPKINLVASVDSIYPKCINSDLRLKINTSYNDSILIHWGDGTDTTVKNNAHLITHPYSLFGMKQVYVKAVANLCSDSIGFVFNVRPKIQLTASNDTTLCLGISVSLWAQATGADSVFNYILKTPSGNIFSASGLFLISPNSTTNYLIGAINNCANDTVWKPIKVTINGPLKMQLNFTDTTVCNGSVVTARVTPTGGNGNYQFYLKRNNIIQQTNTTGIFNIIATTNETYTVVLSDNCTTVNDSADIKIKIFNDLKFTQTIPDAFVCSGDAVNIKALTNLGSGKVNFVWKDAGGTSLSLLDTLYFIPNTSSQIILTATDVCKTITDTFWIYLFPTTTNKNISSDVISGCVPLTVNFESPVLTFSNNKTYEAHWNFGDGTTLIQNFDQSIPVLKAKHVFKTAGVYQVEVKGSAGSCDTFTTIVEALAIPQITLSIAPEKITLPKTQCTATITTSNADSVVIDWGDGTTDNLNFNLSLILITHDYTDTGHYTVKATAYHKNTCYTETYFNIFHADTFMCFVPNAFTPNRDGNNETFKPIVTYCTYYELYIYTRWGQLIFEGTYSAGQTMHPSWSGEDFPSGTFIYMIHAKDCDGRNHDVKGIVMLVR